MWQFQWDLSKYIRNNLVKPGVSRCTVRKGGGREEMSKAEGSRRWK